MYSSNLLNKISSNTETIGIIGLGYVGLPLAVSFAQAGVKVIGLDRSQDKVDQINREITISKISAMRCCVKWWRASP